MVVMMVVLGAFPVQSQALPLSFDTDILLLLTGPVSEATQETVLLVRRGDNFITKDSLLIGCAAGATAGLLVSVIPTLGFVDSFVGAPLSGTYLVGTALLSCTMSIAASVAGMGTAWALNKWHTWIDTPEPPPPAVVAKRVDKPPTTVNTIKPAKIDSSSKNNSNTSDSKGTQTTK